MRIGAAAGLIALATLAACADDGAITGPAADAAMATSLCDALRDRDNDLVRVANDAVAGIESSAPTERRESIIAGFDAAEVAAATFADGVADLELPAIDEEPELRAEVERGARLAVDEVQAERARFTDDVPSAVTDDDVQGRVGQFFNSIEKVMALVEPAIARYDRRALQRAFLDEPVCRHVIQQFRLDDG